MQSPDNPVLKIRLGSKGIVDFPEVRAVRAKGQRVDGEVPAPKIIVDAPKSDLRQLPGLVVLFAASGYQINVISTGPV